MSVEAGFGITGWVFQASGSELSWDISWPGVLDDGRFAAVSFQSDFAESQLVRVSEWFSSDLNENSHIGELIRATEGFGKGVAFRFSVVVIPNH
jgi:hypothetical protein